jgi:arabinogalactan endo-1,4-beta-galactosidase
MKMINTIISGWNQYLLLILLLLSCSKKESASGTTPTPPDPDSSVYYSGVDLSFLPEIENSGTVFKDSTGQPADVLNFMHSKGADLVRLRLWHTPLGGHSDLAEVMEFSSRIRDAGMDILLEIHFSDTWADPGQQTIPVAWSGLSLTLLQDSVFNYTKRVISALKDQQTMPVIVQIGNETNSGFLWDQGRVGGNFDDNWSGFVSLLKAAIDGVRSVDLNRQIEIMIHIAGTEPALWFFEQLKPYNIDFQIIGISYYSVWHGTDLEALKSDLGVLASTYKKQVMIVETSYP